MKRFLQLIIIFSILFACTLFFKQVDAYVILVTATQKRTTSLFFALVLLIAAFVVFYLLLSVLLSVLNVGGFFKRRRYDRGVRAEGDAITNLLEGSVFEEELQSATRLEVWAQKTMDPKRAIELYCLLTHQMIEVERFDRANFYLKRAKMIAEHEGELEQMCTLSEVSLLLAQGDVEKAEPLFESLRGTFSKKPTYILNKLKFLLNKKEFVAYFKLLDSMEKRHVFEAPLLQELRLDGRLEQVESLEDVQDLQRMYNKWSKTERSDSLLVSVLVQRLLDLGDHKLAVRVLETCLDQSWNPSLLALYDDIDVSDEHKMSAYKSWLRDYPNTPALVIALSRILIKKELWGRATQLLQDALAVEVLPEYLELLFHIYVVQKEPNKACELLNKSMLLRHGQLISGDESLLSLESVADAVPAIEMKWEEPSDTTSEQVIDHEPIEEPVLTREAALVRALRKSNQSNIYSA